MRVNKHCCAYRYLYACLDVHKFVVCGTVNNMMQCPVKHWFNDS